MRFKNFRSITIVTGIFLSQGCSTASHRKPASTSDSTSTQKCIPFTYNGSANGAVPSTQDMACATDQVQVTVWSRDGSFNSYDNKALFEQILSQSKVVFSKPAYSSKAFILPIYIMSKGDYQTLMPTIAGTKNITGASLATSVSATTLYENGSYPVLDTGSTVCTYPGTISAMRIAQIGEQKSATITALDDSSPSVNVTWQMNGGSTALSRLAALAADPEVGYCSVNFSNVPVTR